tara:strand:- start:789 stop:1124 length:336 start_codon:yes stop_codon:yes gene_type:complete
MFYVLILLFELIYEVRSGDKHDFLSAMFLSGLILASFLFGLAQGHYLGIFYYLLIRFAIFDISYAVLKGRKWWYLGTTSIWDKIIVEVNKYVLLSFRLTILITIIIHEGFT